MQAHFPFLYNFAASRDEVGLLFFISAVYVTQQLLLT